MTQIIPADHDWSDLRDRLRAVLDLETSARDTGAFTRKRALKDAEDLLRLALAYSPGGLSLRDVACWAETAGIGSLSDVAVLGRLRSAGTWLERIIGRLLEVGTSEKAASKLPLILIDGTIIPTPGPRHGENWRLHAAYDTPCHRSAKSRCHT